MQTQNEVVIVGPMGPSLPVPFHKLQVIAVDGGAEWSPKIDLWVGDHDSWGGALPETKRVLLSKYKHKSDLAHALMAVSASVHVLHLWGFLGGRKDHEWFNVGEVNLWLQNKDLSHAVFYHDSSTEILILCSRGAWTFHHEGIFSLGSFEENEIKIEGACEYQLSEKTKMSPLSSQGLSNQAFGEFKVWALKPFFYYGVFPLLKIEVTPQD